MRALQHLEGAPVDRADDGVEVFHEPLARASRVALEVAPGRRRGVGGAGRQQIGARGGGGFAHESATSRRSATVMLSLSQLTEASIGVKASRSSTVNASAPVEASADRVEHVARLVKRADGRAARGKDAPQVLVHVAGNPGVERRRESAVCSGTNTQPAARGVVIVAPPRRIEPEAHGRRAVVERQRIRGAPDGLGIDPQVMQSRPASARRAERVAHVRPRAEERVGIEAVDRGASAASCREVKRSRRGRGRWRLSA